LVSQVAEWRSPPCVHLLVVDLFPPTGRDPQGIHKAIWDEIPGEPFELPPNNPLTLAVYPAGPKKVACVEPIAVGDVLLAMPLFLEPGMYVPAPLEETYQTTWSVCPAPLQYSLLTRPVRGAGLKAVSVWLFCLCGRSPFDLLGRDILDVSGNVPDVTAPVLHAGVAVSVKLIGRFLH
jgi:hypothetical protein